MVAHIRRSVSLAAVFIVIAFAYALAGTGVSQLLFHHRANGSITADGSPLIGQAWSSPRWFHGRPDDLGPYAAVVCAPDAKDCTPRAGGDNPLRADGVSGRSGATNVGPRSQTLLDDTRALVAYWHSMGVEPTPDLVTTSGSGYDPDISPADARAQIPMVAWATGLSTDALERLIRSETHGPQFGFLGSSWIDVLSLNQGLGRLEK